MERRTNSPYPRLDRPVLAVVGVLLVASTVLFTLGDRQHEWRYYQWAFKNTVKNDNRQELLVFITPRSVRARGTEDMASLPSAEDLWQDRNNP